MKDDNSNDVENINNLSKKLSDDNSFDEDFFDDDLFDDGFDFKELEYPEVEIETEDLAIIITLKKDYSKIKDVENRKKEFKKDINDFFKEFTSTEEFHDLMTLYFKE